MPIWSHFLLTLKLNLFQVETVSFPESVNISQEGLNGTPNFMVD